MPFMDGTGPLGSGPGSGRGRGMCAGARRGFGMGMRGRGFRSGRPGLQPAQDERAALEAQASLMERQLERIHQRMSALGKQEPAAQG